jgi:hypothetical protein
VMSLALSPRALALVERRESAAGNLSGPESEGSELEERISVIPSMLRTLAGIEAVMEAQRTGASDVPKAGPQPFAARSNLQNMLKT